MTALFFLIAIYIKGTFAFQYKSWRCPVTGQVISPDAWQITESTFL